MKVLLLTPDTALLDLNAKSLYSPSLGADNDWETYMFFIVSTMLKPIFVALGLGKGNDSLLNN